MRLPFVFVAVLLALSVWPAAEARDREAQTGRAEALAKYGLDIASSLESRVGETPASVLKMFAEAGMGAPTPHLLSAAERRTFVAAFAALTPLHQRILRERVRTISFLDGMPNTALTSTVNADDAYRLFDITIRASVLSETVSQFLTDKERTCFDSSGTLLSVSIEAGTMDAIVYVLLHEATHVVDSSLRLTPVARPGEGPGTVPGSPFTDGVWTDRTTIAASYRDPLLDRIKFRAGGETQPIDRAEAVYSALRKTPFASLYGSSNWHDDLAELVSWYHLTENARQPYRIVIRKSGTEVFAYEPMTSPIVRRRFPLMDRFYADGR